MIKRVFSLVIVIVMVLLPLSVIHAEEITEGLPGGMPSSSPYATDEFIVVNTTNDKANYISTHALTISSSSAGHISVAVSVDTTQTMKKLGFTTLTVQHWNGSVWEDVWTKSDQYATDTDTFSYSKTITNMASNDYYRVTVDLYAKKGFLQVQTMTLISNYILCR